MPDNHWTETGEAVTELILDVFRLNGRLLIAGDRLVADLGLTSARWQVLGAIAYAERPEPVSWHARNMGVHRQGVQRIVNELEKEGIVEFQPNPHHKRAHLVVLSTKGKNLFEQALKIQAPWVNALSTDLTSKEISAAKAVVKQLTARLEADQESQSQNV
ncbi:MAG: MarR family winged helix-turn-helix transcriptional regulator [Pseudomonadota bacterium]